MKLSKIDFYLDWPDSVDIRSLRRFIIENLLKKGEVIRWSIIDIQSSMDAKDTKKIRIYAVLGD